MVCPRCGSKMQVQAHRPHKKEKWICPKCRKIRMKRARPRGRRPRRQTDWHRDL